VDSALVPFNADVVVAFAEVAVHDALEDEAHPLLELVGVGAEKGKIEIEMITLNKQRSIGAQVDVE